MRIVITGPPRSGKSTAAKLLGAWYGITPRATDELLPLNLDWSENSRVVSEWFDQPGDWIVEGVVVPRAIRKWHMNHPDSEPPFDRFLLLRTPHDNLLKLGQQVMAKQVIALIEEYKEWIGPRWLEVA